jgi:hypothetical protein
VPYAVACVEPPPPVPPGAAAVVPLVLAVTAAVDAALEAAVVVDATAELEAAVVTAAAVVPVVDAAPQALRPSPAARARLLMRRLALRFMVVLPRRGRASVPCLRRE